MITFITVMAADNPFVYGEIVAAGAFADRDDEFHRLTEDLRAGQKIFLISPRRYGKSSLIRRSLDALAKERVLTVSVTVAGSSSYVGFLEAYAQALLAADTPVGRLRAWAMELFRVVRPEVTVDAAGPGTATVAPVSRISTASPSCGSSVRVPSSVQYAAMAAAWASACSGRARLPASTTSRPNSSRCTSRARSAQSMWRGQ